MAPRWDYFVMLLFSQVEVYFKKLQGLKNWQFLLRKEKPRCLLTREDLPVLYQLLPDDFPHDLCADAEQLGDGRVGVVEAVQQNLRYLSFLLPYQPERMEVWFKRSSV